MMWTERMWRRAFEREFDRAWKQECVRAEWEAERERRSEVMATVKIEIDEKTLRRIVLSYLSAVLKVSLEERDVQIETKSAQNYRSEWERASFRARVDKEIP